ELDGTPSLRVREPLREGRERRSDAFPQRSRNVIALAAPERGGDQQELQTLTLRITLRQVGDLREGGNSFLALGQHLGKQHRFLLALRLSWCGAPRFESLVEMSQPHQRVL